MNEIEKWVKEQLEAGYTIQQIKDNLIQNGQNPRVVDYVLASEKKDEETEEKASIKNKSKFNIILIIGVFMLLISSIFYVDITLMKHLNKLNLNKNLLLNYISTPSKSEIPPVYKTVIPKITEDKNTCKRLCSQFINNNFDTLSAIEYCKKNFQIDFDGDNRTFIEDDEYYFYYPEAGSEYYEYRAYDVCEDRIYCFHMYDCKWDEGKLDFDKCLSILCNYYYYNENPKDEHNYTVVFSGSHAVEAYIRNSVLPASDNIINIGREPHHTCDDWGWEYNLQRDEKDPLVYVGYNQESWYNKLLQSDFCNNSNS